MQSIISKISKTGSDGKDAAGPPAPTGGPPATPPPAVRPMPLTLRTTPLPGLQARLWNDAYDSLGIKEPKLVNGYERIISSKLNSKSQAKNSHITVERGDASNVIYQDRERRWRQMQSLADHELGQIDTFTASSRMASRSLHIMGALRGGVSTALQTVPQGAIAWTGVVMGLEVCLSSFLILSRC